MLPPVEPSSSSEARTDIPAVTSEQAVPSITRLPGIGLAWWMILAVIVLDQLTKALVRQGLALYSSVPIIPGFMDLVHVHNRGVAFGLFNDVSHPQRGLMTTALAVIALAGIAYYARHVRAHERLARVGLSLILGGAIGNLTDRIRQGFVVDFVDVYWGDWHFWAFNVADAAITIGAGLIFVELLLSSRHAPDPV